MKHFLFVMAFLPLVSSQTGWASRYWDCCKAHCSWEGNTFGSTAPAKTCTRGGDTFAAAVGALAPSACENNVNSDSAAYACWDNIPFAVSENLAYGFAAVPGDSVGDTCGKCYELTFTGDGFFGANAGASALGGKRMIVQASNIGYDVESNQFDIQLPGGGVGAFDACSSQWGVSKQDLGVQYGGFLSACQQGELGFSASLAEYKECVSDKCEQIFGNGKFPHLLAGCQFFVDWYEVADNPVHTFREVECPADLTAISGMSRGDFDSSATPAPTTNDDVMTPPQTDNAEPPAPLAGDAVYDAGCDYSAAYSITDTWVGGYNAQLTVSGGASGLNNWEASFVLGGSDRITTSWNGVFKGDTGEITVLGHAAWNRNIAAGGSVSSGFTVEGNGAQFPEAVVVGGQQCTKSSSGDDAEDSNVPTVAPTPAPTPAPTATPTDRDDDNNSSEDAGNCDGAGASLRIDNSWNSGYVLVLTIDGGASGLTNWAATFDLPRGHKINSHWNADFRVKRRTVSVNGDAAWNRDVSAGGRAEAGFVVEGDPADAPAVAELQGCPA